MLAGKLTISRIQTTDRDDRIAIRLVDDSSNARPVEIFITPHDFAVALTGLGSQPCEFDWRPTEVGKRREVKTEIVPFPDNGVYSTRRGRAMMAIEPFTKDGWQGRVDDLLSHHNYAGTDADGTALYRVTFIRFVENTSPE